MKNEKGKKQVFSELEKEVAISILNGMPLQKCSILFGVDESNCKKILHKFCMRSNRFLYEKLQNNYFNPASLGKLRDNSQLFIRDSKKLENVNINSPIWALPDVPITTLNALWNNKYYTVKDVLQNSQRRLLRFRCLGRVGLEKLIISLNNYGFSIKE